MFAANPKKEFTIAYPIDAVKASIHKMIAADPSYYVLIKDDAVLNQIRIHQKGVLLDAGYHIDFDLQKMSDSETRVLIEVSRNIGTINTSAEVSIANNSLKTAASNLSAFLSGDINPKTGRANNPANTGCLLFFVIGSLWIIIHYFL